MGHDQAKEAERRWSQQEEVPGGDGHQEKEGEQGGDESDPASTASTDTRKRLAVQRLSFSADKEKKLVEFFDQHDFFYNKAYYSNTGVRNGAIASNIGPEKLVIGIDYYDEKRRSPYSCNIAIHSPWVSLSLYVSHLYSYTKWWKFERAQNYVATARHSFGVKGTVKKIVFVFLIYGGTHLRDVEGDGVVVHPDANCQRRITITGGKKPQRDHQLIQLWL